VNQAAWKCEDCRRNGLEIRRRCGWLAIDDEPTRVVWARGAVATDRCPVSEVSAESMALIQEFQAWKLFGSVDVFALPARTVEAFFILENELRAEMKSEH
jgi:hypothetical protein